MVEDPSFISSKLKKIYTYISCWRLCYTPIKIFYTSLPGVSINRRMVYELLLLLLRLKQLSTLSPPQIQSVQYVFFLHSWISCIAAIVSFTLNMVSPIQLSFKIKGSALENICLHKFISVMLFRSASQHS